VPTYSLSSASKPSTRLSDSAVVDFHNHLIPGVDDGAADLDESRRGLAAMREQGVGTIITTPHIKASALAFGSATDYLDRVDAAWHELKTVATTEFPTLRLERGFEVLLDAPRVDLSDSRLRLAGTRFVLVEFPWNGLPVNSANALFDIKMSGHTPIVAHPERYSDMDRNLTVAESWQRVGAFLQVNEGSLLGHYGARAQALGWASLECGMANYLCGDFHTRGVCPTLTAREALSLRDVGQDLARLLMEVNPARMLEGLDPIQIEPIRKQKRPWWKRFLGGR
jgi:protein-tyrosine phosphatase